MKKESEQKTEWDKLVVALCANSLTMQSTHGSPFPATGDPGYEPTLHLQSPGGVGVESTPQSIHFTKENYSEELLKNSITLGGDEKW